MKISSLVLSLALVVPTFSSFAGELISGNNLDILAIDGVKQSSSLFGSDDIELANGQHQLVVKYIETFANENLVESRPYIFNIDVKGSTTITTERLRSKAIAENRVNKDLNWYVENDNGKSTISNADQLEGQGFMPFSDIEKLVAEYNGESTTKVVSAAPAVTPKKQSSSVNMIIEQYKMATTEQKKQFKIWLIENETK